MIRAEVLVVGGGPAGVLAGLRAGDLGARTVIVTKGELGEMAADDGPVPVRTLAHAARLMRDARQLADTEATVGAQSNDGLLWKCEDRGRLFRREDGVRRWKAPRLCAYSRALLFSHHSLVVHERERHPLARTVRFSGALANKGEEPLRRLPVERTLHVAASVFVIASISSIRKLLGLVLVVVRRILAHDRLYTVVTRRSGRIAIRSEISPPRSLNAEFEPKG